MSATPELPTWQILPTGEGHFQWIIASGDRDLRPEELPKTLSSRLPSMSDLLLQAPSKLLEGGCGGEVPMFRTGSGKSVSVRQSSIWKARSVIEGGDAIDRGAVTVVEGGSSNDGNHPMFRTGSGKSVMVRQSSVRKAAAVLEGEILERGAATVVEDGGFPMFCTGSGKSVMVRQSSIRNAAAILEGEVFEKELLKPLKCGRNKDDAPMFHTGSGKSVFLRQSSIRKAMSVLQDGENTERDQTCNFTVDGDCSFSNSLFRSGSGKTVNLSSAGLSRATTLLGLEGNDNLSTSKCFEHAINKSDANVTTKRENLHDKGRWSMHPGTDATFNTDPVDVQSVQRNSLVCPRDFPSLGNQSYEDALQNFMGAEVHSSDFAQPPIKFHTAGGRSISISSDALKRARSLLGDSELGTLQNDVNADHSMFLVKDEKIFDEVSCNKENISFACLHQNAGMGNHSSKVLPRVRSFTNPKKSSSPLSGANSRGVMLNQVHANQFLSEGIQRSSSNISHLQEPSKKDLFVAHCAFGNSRMLPECRPLGGPLVEISNNICTGYATLNGLTSEKKRPQKRSSISPFKRPRISRFTTHVNNSISLLTTDSTTLSISENCCCRTRVSTHYPFKFRRKTIDDYFGAPPGNHNLYRQLPDRVKHMNADNAEMYRFDDASGSDGIGTEDFQNMLLQSGASLSSATKEWVANHYKWIVWKLACLERCYPAQASGKLLTASNVLEELKYRYEREVNYGHRSAVKKILDGDASPASMMVLSISSIHSCSVPKAGKLNDTTDLHEGNKKLSSLGGDESNHATKIELTDGWYSLDAILDVLLSKQLVAGKLFVGQKLRIWGAGICGWVGPILPLEASKTVSLMIHINGTYRAHWSEPLGFCKGLGAPLAFRCIKGAGGIVPRTLVGVTRIYPVLYKERFVDGGSIVRSERMERKVLQLYNQRRSNIVDDIMAEQHDVSVNANDSEEGARIFKILETAAEPEVLMADMSSEQLISFSTYQAKQEAIRQSNMQKKIEKALEDAGLSLRDVTPFMRVRVVGLNSTGSHRKGHPREGLITIWNPTEKQKLDLVEGQIYSVAGLMPLNFGSDILYLQARGSSTVWKPLLSVTEKFEPFFTPRKPVLLSNLGEVPLASEFDIAAVVVYVGEVYISGCQKKQWVFVTDESRCISELQFEELYDCLLAVSFCSPINDVASSGLLSQCLSGDTVGFCNLVKRARDQMNHLWVAEATENSSYSVCDNLPNGFHLKEAADSAKKWAKVSCSTIQKLRERVLCIVGGHGS